MTHYIHYLAYSMKTLVSHAIIIRFCNNLTFLFLSVILHMCFGKAHFGWPIETQWTKSQFVTIWQAIKQYFCCVWQNPNNGFYKDAIWTKWNFGWILCFQVKLNTVHKYELRIKTIQFKFSQTYIHNDYPQEPMLWTRKRVLKTVLVVGKWSLFKSGRQLRFHLYMKPIKICKLLAWIRSIKDFDLTLSHYNFHQ